jgi:hypothetical protein
MSDQSGAVLSAEQEQELLKPIESHIAEIQKKIDALRKNGTDRVVQLQGDIDAIKRDRILTKEERSATIEQYRVDLEDAKKVEESHEKEVSELISEAVSYLNEHFESQYLRPVEASCAQEKILAKQQYAERLASLRKSIRPSLQASRIEPRSKTKTTYTKITALMRRWSTKRPCNRQKIANMLHLATNTTSLTFCACPSSRSWRSGPKSGRTTNTLLTAGSSSLKMVFISLS